MVLEDLVPDCRGTIDDSTRMDGRVVVEEGAEVVESVIRGPCIIGRGSKIVKSYIGPFTSIYHNVLVEESEIEHSIVLENSVIRRIPGRIEDSLIGKNVEITHHRNRPKSFRFVVGDNSKVGLI